MTVDLDRLRDILAQAPAGDYQGSCRFSSEEVKVLVAIRDALPGLIDEVKRVTLERDAERMAVNQMARALRDIMVNCNEMAVARQIALRVMTQGAAGGLEAIRRQGRGLDPLAPKAPGT